MEAYHVVATHPQILAGICDANSKYDVFGNYARAITPNGVPSPHLSNVPQEEPLPDTSAFKMRHPLTNAIYDTQPDSTVLVTHPDGRSGVFTAGGTWVSGDLGDADPHMCQWLAGKQLEADDEYWNNRRGNGASEDDGDDIPADDIAAESAADELDKRMEQLGLVGDGPTGSVREIGAAAMRDGLRPVLGDLVDSVPDAELNDSIYFTLFPNFHPWGSFNRIVYRFRPNGNNPDESIMECLYLAPYPLDGERPPAAPIHWIDVDDDWTEASELGMLARVFNQDTYNLPRVQLGLHATKWDHVQFGNYGETKIRHFHKLLEAWMARE